MTAFAFEDYRDFVRARAEARKHEGLRYADLAASLVIQPTYLSRVLRKEAHLSADQLFLFAQELRLSSEELNFINLSLECLRAGLKARQLILRERLRALQKQSLDPKRHLKGGCASDALGNLQQEYFLEPLAPLVHVFLSVPQYKRQPEKIRRALGISFVRFSGILLRLERLGMITLDKKGHYQLLQDHLHLEKNSALHEVYQIVLRAASAEHCKKIDKDDKCQFTVTFGADEATHLKIREEFNRFLQKAEELGRGSPSEGVYQMNFDLFRWDFESSPTKMPARVSSKEVEI